MKTTTPILSELQNNVLRTSAIQLVDGVDLSYGGYTVDGSDFVLHGTDAIKNKLLFWVTSTYGDYVREPSKGGILYTLVGKTLTETNIDTIKNSISTFFLSTFKDELTLMNISVIADKQQRRWVITLYVADVIRRELLDVTVGVQL